MNPRNIVISHFICPECGMDIPLPRTRNKQREYGHKKFIYCPRCKTKHNFEEYAYSKAYRNMDGDVL